MEIFLVISFMAVMLIGWTFIRERFAAVEERLAVLERASWAAAPRPQGAPPPPPPATPPTVRPEPLRPEPVQLVAPEAFLVREPPVPRTEPTVPPAATPRVEEEVHAWRSSEEWEALIGGNWANKLGVFVTVIALALLLKYAYAQLGPAGRVALSMGVSFAMLAAGVIFERREQYRTFSYGLIGGGWAALYTTVYAMHAMEAAKVVDSPLLATVLLLFVVAGMIAHSLKYQSRTVTGLAYFIAFATLAISEVTTFSVVVLIPLAASLLYVASRNGWDRFAIFGLVATYLTCAMHKDSGSPLWQTQALFLLYWLVFEAFDLMRADDWLLPLNALGFLVLSSGKWSHAAPQDIWQLAAGSAVLYLGSTLVRARAGRWKPPVLLNAALATTAIVLKLHDQWVPLALLAGAELYYLAGVRFRSVYLRTMAGAIFGLELGILLLQDTTHLPAHSWEPVAALNVAVFYLNRALQVSEVWYGYAAAAMAALVTGFEAKDPWRGRIWSLMAMAPFAFGWWRRLFDFRMQGYALAAAGVVAIAIYTPYPALSLAIGTAVAYGFVLVTLWSAEDRFGAEERGGVRVAVSLVATTGAAALIWRLVPGEYLGAAWIGLAVAMLEAGLRDLPREFRVQACLVGLLGATRAIAFDLSSPLALTSAMLSYYFAWRSQDEARGRVADAAVFPGTLFLMAGLRAILPAAAVSAAWAVTAVLLAEIPRKSLRAQAWIIGAVVFARCLTIDVTSAHAIAAIAPVIACYWAAMLRRPRDGADRLFFSLLGTTLLAVLIYHEVSGSVLTVAWGIEGVALLAAGFALPDRVPRLSGLAILLGCIAKLFLWDLRNLDTLPRIFSFIVLGLLLVGVSWVYTRFRDQVRRYL
uniref:Membrane protein-like protein n=1 Tax=Solibacter usitatus (strain Ellin6076) TaxID=234267 RepID=Q02BH4_SOLUE